MFTRNAARVLCGAAALLAMATFAGASPTTPKALPHMTVVTVTIPTFDALTKLAPGQRAILTLEAHAVPAGQNKYEYDMFRTYHPYAEIACTVRNISKQPVTIETETVGWCYNWHTDSKKAQSLQWSTTANMSYTFVLSPGETYTRNVPVVLDYDTKEGQAVTFRMAFLSRLGMFRPQEVPIPNNPASNPVTLVRHGDIAEAIPAPPTPAAKVPGTAP